MKKIVVIFSLFLFFSLLLNTAKAQVSQVNQTAQGDEDDRQGFIKLRNTLEGYYQIQVVNSRIKPTVSYGLLKKIEENQSNDQSVTFNHTVQGVRVVILPKNSPQLIESDKKIIYIEE